MNADLESREAKPQKSRLLFWVSLIVGLFVAGIAVVHLVEDRRGASEWETYRKKLEAEGEVFGWEAYLPPKVEETDNFVATPFLKAVGYKGKPEHPRLSPFKQFNFGNTVRAYSSSPRVIDQAAVWDDCPGFAGPAPEQELAAATEVLAALSPVEETLEELRSASQRTASQFDSSGPPFESPVPNFIAMRLIGQVVTIHASASLAVGDTETAFEDWRVLHQLSVGLQEGPPILISTMVGAALQGFELQVIWEGLARGKWSDEQLLAIQAASERVKLL